MSSMHEHDNEPVPGLPQELPEGERILWQGRSEFSSLATSTLHLRKLAGYFAALLALRVAFKLNDGVALTEAISGSLGLTVLAVAALGLLAYYAKRAAAASMFTITDRRIVLRCGVAVTVTVNLPYTIIDSAELRLHKDGSGDISIRTDRSSRASYVLLWPMVKPFRWFPKLDAGRAWCTASRQSTSPQADRLPAAGRCGLAGRIRDRCRVGLPAVGQRPGQC